MGIMSASCSFTRFRLVDDVPQSLWGQLPEKLKLFAFQDIDNTAEERSLGWTCFDDMLDTEWHTAPPDKGAYIVFSLRLDTRRVPAGVIKKHLTIALNAEKQKMAEQGKKFVSRERKKEVKEQVLLRLRSRFLPVPAEFNVLWATDTGHIWFASTQGKMVQTFMDYFTQTFDLHIEQLTPYGLAASLLNDTSLTHIDRLEPTQFAAENV